MMDVEGDVERRGCQAVETLLESGICASANYCQTTESTNTKALSDLRHGVIDAAMMPRVYLTDEQTSGRGRHGRTWISDGGTLTFSLAVDRGALDGGAGQLLPLAVGVGIARWIDFEFAPLQAKLKWPNDVHLGGGKVAGVLLETIAESPHQVIVGVGVNVSSQPTIEPMQSASATRSLSRVVGREVRRYEILSPLVQAIMEALSQLGDSTDELIEDFQRRCLLSGQPIRFQHKAEQRRGICCGIAGTGELLVETSEGIQHVQSGDAQLIRLAGD